MKAIIENGMPNEGIQNCFVSLSGVVIIFDSNVAVVVPSPRSTTRAYGTCKAIRGSLVGHRGLT